MTPRPSRSATAPAGPPLKGDDAADLARHLGDLAGAGLPLPPGLRALAEELPSGPLRRALLRLAADMEAGTPLAEAIEAQGAALPAHVRGLLTAAARSGRLAEVFAGFLGPARVGEEIRRQVALGLVYPLVLLASCFGLFALIALISARQFDDVFRDFGIEVPALSAALLRAARAVADAGLWVVGGPILASVLVLGLGRALFSAAERRRFVNALPLYGPLARWAGAAEFCQGLALLLDAGLPLPEALPLVGSGLRDADLAEACGALAEASAAGLPLADALAGTPRFPDGFGAFLAWAEGHHALPEALRMAGEMFEARARAQAEFLANFARVVAVVLVLWWIAVVLVALFWPMIVLIWRLSG